MEGKRAFGLVCTSNPSVSHTADSSPYTGEPMGRGERVRERDLPRSGYSTQHLPSAEVKQAEIGTGTPSPEAGEGGKRGQMRLRHPISTV